MLYIERLRASRPPGVMAQKTRGRRRRSYRSPSLGIPTTMSTHTTRTWGARLPAPQQRPAAWHSAHSVWTARVSEQMWRRQSRRRCGGGAICAQRCVNSGGTRKCIGRPWKGRCGPWDDAVQLLPRCVATQRAALHDSRAVLFLGTRGYRWAQRTSFCPPKSSCSSTRP